MCVVACYGKNPSSLILGQVILKEGVSAASSRLLETQRLSPALVGALRGTARGGATQQWCLRSGILSELVTVGEADTMSREADQVLSDLLAATERLRQERNDDRRLLAEIRDKC